MYKELRGRQVFPDALVSRASQGLWAKTERLARRAVLEIRAQPERRGLLAMPGIREFLVQQVLSEILASPVIRVIPVRQDLVVLLD